MEIAIKKYIDYIKYTKRFSDQTVKAYFSDLNHFFSYVINKKIEFNEISEYDVSDYINYLKISLEARYAALMMCMEKSYGSAEEAKTHHLTLKSNK